VSGSSHCIPLTLLATPSPLLPPMIHGAAATCRSSDSACSIAAFERVLQVLKLSSCAVASLGEGLSRLPYLHTLHLNLNSLSASSFDPLSLLPSLTDLDISGNAMVTLPPSVKRLTDLRALRIRSMGLCVGHTLFCHHETLILFCSDMSCRLILPCFRI
jgi:Leucine-rich repeat (LRR) protein